jgi:hypothetical protein
LTDDVQVAIVPLHLEVPMVRGKPAIENLIHEDPSIADG